MTFHGSLSDISSDNSVWTEVMYQTVRVQDDKLMQESMEVTNQCPMENYQWPG